MQGRVGASKKPDRPRQPTGTAAGVRSPNFPSSIGSIGQVSRTDADNKQAQPHATAAGTNRVLLQQAASAALRHHKESVGKAVRRSSALSCSDDVPPALDLQALSCSAETRASSSTVVARADVMPQISQSSELPSTLGMDVSPSPTQPNDDRSYERFQSAHSPLLDLLHSSAESSSAAPPAPDEDGSGYLGFGDGIGVGIGTHKNGLFGLDDCKPVGFSPVAPFATDALVGSMRSPAGRPPETPAPPKNPFATNGQAALLGGSQLFRQTQPSSVARRISPTSSRPSPNDLTAFSTFPNRLISSPLKNRLRTSPIAEEDSSPQVPDTCLRPQDGSGPLSDPASSTPVHPLASEWSRVAPRRKKNAAERMAEYEPMGKSQERRQMLARHPPSDSGDDDSANDDAGRRQRVRRRKEEATRQLSSIRVKAFSTLDDVEVPSTTKRPARPPSEAEQYVAQTLGRKSFYDSEGPETVADSQEATARRLEHGLHPGRGIGLSDAVEGETPGSFPKMSREMPSSPAGRAARRLGRGSAKVTRNDPDPGDAIPETSPTESIRLKALGGRNQELSSSFSGRLSSPNVRGGLPPSSHLPPTCAQKSTVPTSPLVAHETTPHEPTASADQGIAPITPSLAEAFTKDAVPSSPSASAAAQEHPSLAGPSSSALDQSTSALSSLGETPVLSSETTPATQESGSGHLPTSATATTLQSSPVAAKTGRRQALEALPRLKATAAETRAPALSRAMRQKSLRHYSSIDELARSSSAASASESSLRVSRTHSRTSSTKSGMAQVKAHPASRDQSVHSDLVFEGMAFAISLQSRKAGESLDEFSNRMQHAMVLEKKIRLAGGRVLDNGFDELFDKLAIQSATASPAATPSPPGKEIALRSTAASTGFAALIADGHSRKVKYMQALALGLPCIAARWIVTCVEKGRLVDWEPYLLCAGQSSFLGDAIRSRNLAPYDAATTRLRDVLKGRPRFLEGNHVLLVMKKADERKRMAYVFLACLLGASLSRVYTVDEARTKLKAMEALGRPYDWVYVDKAGSEELFVSRGAPEGRKRKRSSTSSAAADPSPKRIRTLDDEIIIQSLILGRLINEDETADGEIWKS